MQLDMKNNWKYKLCEVQLRTQFWGYQIKLKQPLKKKAKYWFNQKCTDVIYLRNGFILQMIQYLTLNKNIYEK